MTNDSLNKFRLTLSDGTSHEMWSISDLEQFRRFINVNARQGKQLTGTTPKTESIANWTNPFRRRGREVSFDAGKVTAIQQVESVSGVYDRRDGEFYRTVRIGKFLIDGKLHELEWLASDLRYKGRNERKPLGTSVPDSDGRLYTVAELSTAKALSAEHVIIDGVEPVADSAANGIPAAQTDVLLASANAAVQLMQTYVNVAKVAVAAEGIASEAAEEAEDIAREAAEKANIAAQAVDSARTAARKAEQVAEAIRTEIERANNAYTAAGNALDVISMEVTESESETNPQEDARKMLLDALMETAKALGNAKSTLDSVSVVLTVPEETALNTIKNLILITESAIETAPEITDTSVKNTQTTIKTALSWLKGVALPKALTVMNEAARQVAEASSLADATTKAVINTVKMVKTSTRKAIQLATEAAEANEMLLAVCNALHRLVGDGSDAVDVFNMPGILDEIDENEFGNLSSVRESRLAIPKATELVKEATNVIKNDDGSIEYPSVNTALGTLKTSIANLDSALGFLVDAHLNLNRLSALRYYAPERGWRIPRKSDLALLIKYALGTENTPQQYDTQPEFTNETEVTVHVSSEDDDKLSGLLSEKWPYYTDGKPKLWPATKRTGFDVVPREFPLNAVQSRFYALRSIERDKDGKHTYHFADWRMRTDQNSNKVSLVHITPLSNPSPCALRLVRTVPVEES